MGITNIAFIGKSAALLGAMLLFGKVVISPTEPPKQGYNVVEIELNDIGGQPRKLSEALEKGPAVVIFMRGYCDGQCTDSSRQMSDFVAQASKFKAEKATVLLIYPGPADGLTSRAREFLGSTTLPDNFMLLLDPDYAVSTKYHLRWKADGETVYPTTLVIDSRYVARFSKISRSHGDRATAAQVLEALKAMH